MHHTYTLSLSLLVLITSYGTTALFHSLVSKYVFHLWRPVSNPSELVFEKRSLFNRKRFLVIPEAELTAGGSVFSTWRWGRGRESFLIQFQPERKEKMVKTWGGEVVDNEAMAELYEAISQRR